jgi:hypothetical protein
VPSSTFFLGYRHTPDEDGARCGGIATFHALQWSLLISSTSFLFENRVHYVILSGLPEGEVGIANVYVPNSSPHRCTLWLAMAQEFSNTCRWILLGDFNMVENKCDKNCPRAHLISSWERTTFEAMKDALHVVDPLRTVGSLQFSWDNQ